MRAASRLYPLVIVIYLLRDVLLVLFFNFGHGGRRGDATAFIILFLAYFPLTGILVSLEHGLSDSRYWRPIPWRRR